MTHRAGKGFVFVSGACTISQCVGPNCFLCENMGWKSRWLAEDLSLAEALRFKLPWLMEMVYTVLPPGSHVGKEHWVRSAPHAGGWKRIRRTPNLLWPLFFFFLPVMSVNNILYFSCLLLSIAIFFFKRSDVVATSVTNRQTSIIICFMTLNLTNN